MRKWPRPPAKPSLIPLNPEEMGEVCSILAREFEDPEGVLVRFKIYLPSWAKLEFESIERMKQEMTRKYAPLLDVIRRYQVRIYDERQYVEIDYRRRWLLDNISIRADAEDEEWCARASGAAWRVLERVTVKCCVWPS